MAKTHDDKLPDAFEVTDVSYLLKDVTDSTDNSDDALVASVEVLSREQETVSLGMFNIKQPPKGFVIEYASEIEPSSVACRIVELAHAGSDTVEYKLFLGNFDDKTVLAEIRKL